MLRVVYVLADELTFGRSPGLAPATAVLETAVLLVKLCSYGWRYRLRSYVLRVKAECTTIVLSANELLVFPSRQRYAVCLLRYTATSSFGFPVFVGAAHSEAPIQKTEARGNPVRALKLSAILFVTVSWRLPLAESI